MVRSRNATAAFARRFDGDIDAEKRNPGRQAVRRAEIISRNQIERRVGTSARGSHAGLGNAQLCPGDFEAWVEVKRRERQHFQIPRFLRPGPQFDAEMGFEESLQFPVVQSPGFQSGRCLRRRDRAGLKPGAAGQQPDQDDHEADNAVGARLCEPQRVATAPSPAGHRPPLRDGSFMESPHEG